MNLEQLNKLKLYLERNKGKHPEVEKNISEYEKTTQRLGEVEDEIYCRITRNKELEEACRI